MRVRYAGGNMELVSLEFEDTAVQLQLRLGILLLFSKIRNKK
jgi:hypothetical protein